MDNLIYHHTNYKETGGVDEGRWMPAGEHRLLHQRLRKEEKCKIPPKELHKISKNAYHRRYRSEDTQRIRFTETLMPYVRLCEELVYNHKTGSVGWTAGFQAQHGKHLWYVDI